MSRPAIRIENLGKRYVVNHESRGQRGGYKTLRESLTDAVSSPFRHAASFLRRPTSPQPPAPSPRSEDFWALKDVSFEVQPGEVVGIIGRNGAGKSTLLKILSQITRPTTGRIELNGRVGSLLEVGTGFHPELTGRENIYLNGSILGMRKREIDRKFDEIVAFAEIEQFLDTPVKRYSSGMYVRLAFAVAAFLEPEILLVDEVLAVGDAIFQRKCIDRMTQLAHNGCSLLFVSHNLDLIPRFCKSAVLLKHGYVADQGDVYSILDVYRESMLQRGTFGDLTNRNRQGSGRATFTALRFLSADGEELHSVRAGEDLRCVLDIRSTYSTRDLSLAVVIRGVQGTRLITSWTEEVGFKESLSPGLHQFECCFKSVPIRPGRQLIFDLWMHDGDTVDYIEDACVVDVVECRPLGFSHRADQGPALCQYEWSKC